MLGHSECALKGAKSNEDDKEKEQEENPPRNKPYQLREATIGDDLGSSRYFTAGARLDFTNMPYLKNIFNAKPYSSAEMTYYPSCTKPSGKPLEDVRGSLGLGINFQINEVANIALHYNMVNFNTKIGDIEKSGISFQFNLF